MSESQERKLKRLKKQLDYYKEQKKKNPFSALSHLFKRDFDLAVDVIDTFPDSFDWKELCSGIHIKFQTKNLPEKLLRKYSDRISWKQLSFSELSEGFVRDYIKKIDFFGLARNKKLSEEFLTEYIDSFNFHDIVLHQKYSLEFVKKFANRFIFLLKKDYNQDYRNYNIEQSEWDKIIEFLKMYNDLI